VVNFEDDVRKLQHPFSKRVHSTYVTYWKYLPCPPMPAAPKPVSAVLWSELESTTDPGKQQTALSESQN